MTPAWLAARLSDPSVRILDVRADGPPSDASGPRLRAVGTVELRAYAYLGASPGWRASRDRHPARSGPSQAYRDGHVPGATALDVRAQLFDEHGELVTAPELAMVMSGLGVGDGDTIVLVDDARPDRALAAAWALARYGHGDVHVLDGGFPRWAAEGRPVTREIVKRRPASFTARVST